MDSIDIVKKGLDRSFAQTEKELKSFNQVLDVSPRTLNRLLKNKTKSRALRIELINTIGHPYIGAEDNFILLSSGQKRNKAEAIIRRHSEVITTSNLLETRQEARGRLLLVKSKEAGNRLGRNVKKYINDISKFTSPSLVSEVKEFATKRVDTITIKLATPSGRKYEKLSTIAGTAMKNAFTTKDNKDVGDLVKSKADLVAQTFLRGAKAVVKQIRRKRKLKEDAAGPEGNLVYIEPFVDDFEQQHGYEKPIHVDMMQTLNLFLSDRIKEKPHMFPAGAPLAPNKEYLRTQTGRFAENAKITSIDSQFNISYTYMHYPYDVFQTGNHGPHRDPEWIIEGAIRSLVQQLYTTRIIGSIYAT